MPHLSSVLVLSKHSERQGQNWLSCQVQFWTKAISEYLVFSTHFSHQSYLFDGWCYLHGYNCRLTSLDFIGNLLVHWFPFTPCNCQSTIGTQLVWSGYFSVHFLMWIWPWEEFWLFSFRTAVYTCSAWIMTTWSMQHSQEGLQGEERGIWSRKFFCSVGHYSHYNPSEIKNSGQINFKVLLKLYICSCSLNGQIEIN